MTHTHDRTLLSSLAFADKDKKDPLHDLAGQYLLRPEVANLIIPLLANSKTYTSEADWQIVGASYYPLAYGVKIPTPCSCGKNNTRVHRKKQKYCAKEFYETKFSNGKLEIPLVKGQGQYRSMIGFVDGGLFYKRDRTRAETTVWSQCEKLPADNQELEMSAENIVDEKRKDVSGFTVPFEVKINREAVGNILRQINTYKEFSDLALGYCPIWILATAYEVTASEQELLSAEGITCVRLGEGFEAFVKEIRAATPAKVLNL